MKSYTDLEQSKKLAEILPIESADMHSEAVDDEGNMVFVVVCGLGDKNKSNYGSPVWSLAALLNILNSIDGWYPGIDAQVDDENLWQICMFSYETGSDISTAALNKELVDVCYEVILKLKEKKIF
jgi:hypothetical protein